MAKETWIVDRIEGEVAVVEGEDGKTFDVPLHFLPPNAREGDVLRVEREAGSGPRSWVVTQDTAAREARRERLRDLAEELREHDPGGDIEL